MGDLSHVPSLSFDVGTSTKNGVRRNNRRKALKCAVKRILVKIVYRYSPDPTLQATQAMVMPARSSHTAIQEMSTVTRATAYKST